MKKATYCIICVSFVLAALVTSCKSSKQVSGKKHAQAEMQQVVQSRFLSSRVELTVPTRDAVFTVNGTMKLLGGERIQISLLMPILRTEVARIDFTPDELLLVDRMGKRYCRVTREAFAFQLPENADFAHLESLIRNVATQDEATLTGEQFGLKGLERAKLLLTNFSDEEFSISSTELSDRYTEVTVDEILRLLRGLQQTNR